MLNIVRIFWVCILFSLLFACGESDLSPAPVFDSSTPSYKSTLADGIDFKRDGYPNFLAGVSGLSGLEGWGRWTDGSVAKFRFKHGLPSKFTLRINAGALGPNVGQKVIIRAGQIEKGFTVTDAVATVYTLSFDDVDNVDTLEVFPPKPARPSDIDQKSTDTRMLGLAMVYLKIQ